MVEKRKVVAPCASSRYFAAVPLPLAMSPPKPKIILLPGIGFYTFVKKFKGNADAAEHIFRFFARVIAFFTDDASQSRIDNHFGANRAWGHFAIQCAAVNGDADF